MGAGATYLALTNAVGCDLSERAPQAETPKGGTPSTPKVSHLPNASSAPREAVRAFRSRPDLNPPAVEVTAQAHSTTAGYIFVAPQEGGAGQGGSMIVDDRGEVVWFRPLQKGTYGRARPQSAELPRQVRAYLDGRGKRPAAVAERTSEEEVRVYASWNGATEVATWEVLAGSSPGQLESLDSVPRDGFETALLARTPEPYVAGRAKHSSGRILGTSKSIEPGS